MNIFQYASHLFGPAANPSSSSSPAVRPAAVASGFRAALPWLMGSLAIAMTALIGQVPTWTLFAFGACAVWRLRIERSGGRLPSLALRLALFVPALAMVMIRYGKPTSAAALLACLVPLLALKILELRSHRDFIVVALLGYFMILSAFFYNQTLALSLYLAVAIAANTIALIRCHDGGRRHPARSSLRLALTLMVQAVPLVVLLFVIFPRLQLDMLRLNRAMTGVTGMSEHLQPGAFASLAQSDEPAFRAKFVSGGPIAARNLYWRGLVLGICESPLSWRAAEARELHPPPRLAGEPRIVEQQITMYGQGERWLFALDRPLGAKQRSSSQPQLVTGGVLRSHSLLFNTSIYTAYSDPSPPSPVLITPVEQDVHAVVLGGFPLPPPMLRLPFDEMALYSDLPAPGLSPRVLALVQGWKRAAQGLSGAARENEIIRQARLFLINGGFTYTLQPGVLPREGALDYFLFKSRKGFCEHYAAAFSTLMRAAGLPSRVVVGYQGGEYNGTWGGYYLIRQSDAHAWSEIWITGRGWQREDPTAVVAPERVSFGAENYEALAADGPLSAESRLDRLTRLSSPGTWRWLLRNSALAWDGLDQQWNLLVLGYDQEKQEDTLQGLGLGNLDWLEGGALALTAALGVIALGALGVRALEREHTAKVDPAARLYERFCRRVARWAGVERAASEGPLDFSKRAAGALPAQAREIQAITDLYVRSRYASPMHDDLAFRTLEALTLAVDNFREPAHREK